MQWLIIFLLVLCGFFLNSCSLLPKNLPSKLPSINTHLGKNETKVAVKRDTNQIDRAVYNYNQIKNLTWLENLLYCVLLIIAFGTEPVVPSIKKLWKKRNHKKSD